MPVAHRLSCLAVCLALVKRCALMYGALPAFHDITRPLRALLAQHLAGGSHPHELQVRLPHEGAASSALPGTGRLAALWSSAAPLEVKGTHCVCE